MIVKAVVPIFYVREVSSASEYYTGVLRFTEAFRYGTYVGLRLGGFEIHVTDPGESRQFIGAGSAYVICDEVDRYFASIEAAAGATLRSEPQDRTYGMRDFAVLDPDGNQLTFGCDLD